MVSREHLEMFQYEILQRQKLKKNKKKPKTNKKKVKLVACLQSPEHSWDDSSPQCRSWNPFPQGTTMSTQRQRGRCVGAIGRSRLSAVWTGCCWTTCRWAEGPAGRSGGKTAAGPPRPGTPSLCWCQLQGVAVGRLSSSPRYSMTPTLLRFLGTLVLIATSIKLFCMCWLLAC